MTAPYFARSCQPKSIFSVDICLYINLIQYSWNIKLLIIGKVEIGFRFSGNIDIFAKSFIINTVLEFTKASLLTYCYLL